MALVEFYDPVAKKNISYHLSPSLKPVFEKLSQKIIKKDQDRVYIVVGEERCLTGDTIINVNRNTLGKKYNLKWMYNQFNNNPDKLKHFKQWDLDSPTFVRSYNGHDIGLNKINNVVYSGNKEIFKIELENGLSIKATKDHKIMTNNGFVELQYLKKEEHSVMCDNNKTQKTQSIRLKNLNRDINICGLIYHPNYIQAKNDGKKNGKRIKIHQLIYEANINNISFGDFIEILSTSQEKSSKLKFVDCSKYCIHHSDFNHYNNNIENLELMTYEKHLEVHSKDSYKNFSQGIPEYIKIKDITYYGEEDTYDIICDEPNHNFVANGIVVHNSGKSTFTFQCAKFIDPTFNIDRICFTAEQYLEVIRTAPKGSVVVFDEAFRGFSSTGGITKINKLLIQAMMEVGRRNLIIFIVLPSFSLLKDYMAIHRSKALFVIYEKQKKSYRAWRCYTKEKKSKIYYKSKRNYGIMPFVQTRLKGKFFAKSIEANGKTERVPYETFDSKEYDKKKDNAFRDKKDEKKDNRKELITFKFKLSTIKFPITNQRELAVAFGVPYSTLKDWRRYGDEMEFSDNEMEYKEKKEINDDLDE